MEKRLNRLIDLFKTTNNTYVSNELELLKAEINIAITEAKIEVYKTVNKTI